MPSFCVYGYIETGRQRCDVNTEELWKSTGENLSEERLFSRPISKDF